MSELSDERINEIIDGTLNITFAESELMAIELKERRASALLGEAATTEWVALPKKDADHFADLLDEMISDLINDRPKWMYHIGGMKVLRDKLRGDTNEAVSA